VTWLLLPLCCHRTRGSFVGEGDRQACIRRENPCQVRADRLGSREGTLAAVEVEVLCDECGTRAGSFELPPSGVPRSRSLEDPSADLQRPRIYLRTFERSGSEELTEEEYEQLRRALVPRD
jgi:hypothetical protein